MEASVEPENPLRGVLEMVNCSWRVTVQRTLLRLPAPFRRDETVAQMMMLHCFRVEAEACFPVLLRYGWPIAERLIPRLYSYMIMFVRHK